MTIINQLLAIAGDKGNIRGDARTARAGNTWTGAAMNAKAPDPEPVTCI